MFTTRSELVSSTYLAARDAKISEITENTLIIDILRNV